MWATLQPDVLAKFPQQMRNGVANTSPAAPHLSADAEKWKKCIDSLLEIRLLEDDWDGQGSPAPAAEVVDSALILAVLLRQHHVVPPNFTVQSVQGSVILEWQRPDGTTFEIDVTEPDAADVFLMVPGQPAQHWEIKGRVVAGGVP